MHWFMGAIGIISGLSGFYGHYFDPRIDPYTMYLISSMGFCAAYMILLWRQ